MRVLIVKTSSMGDVVHALPAVTDMKRCLPDIHIDWLVEQSFAAIPQQHAAVNDVIALQWRKWRRSLGQIETREAIRQWRHRMGQAPYDLIIDMQGLIKSAAFACCAHGPRGGYDWRSIREPLASLLYQRKAQVDRQLHAVTRCRQLAAQLMGYAPPLTPPDFGLRARTPAWQPQSGPYAVLVPCASRPEKLWPLEHWITVAQALQNKGLTIVVMWGSQAEKERAEAIAAQVEAEVPPFLTVRDASDTLAHASIVVGLDTGLTHIAAAHGKPTVGIYCDHQPGLAGLVGSGPVVSLGGKRLIPTTASVLDALNAIPH